MEEVWHIGKTEAQREGVLSLKPHSECERVPELGLEPQAVASLWCWVLPALLPFQQGGGSSRAGCQDLGKHIFSLCPHRASKMAQQPERSPCQRVGLLQDVSEWTAGAREGDIGGLWLLTGQGSCQSLKSHLSPYASRRRHGPADPGGQLCWLPREEARERRWWPE